MYVQFTSLVYRVKDRGEVTKELNGFFSSVAKNLNIPNYQGCDLLSDSIYHLTLKAVVKWRNHPSKRYNNIRARKRA